MRWSLSATRCSAALNSIGTSQRIGVGMRPSDHRPIAESIPAAAADGIYVISSLAPASDRSRQLLDELFGRHRPRVVAWCYRLTSDRERTDVANNGDLADSGAFNVIISANGRFVAWDTAAGNLVAGDGDQAQDVFVRDRRTGKTEGISTRRPTDTFTGQSFVNSISGDGRFVGLESNDVTLVRNDRNGFFSDAFVFDRERGRLQLVSRNSDGE